MLEITDATMYDTGRYVCRVKNPAGEATAETYVQIRKYGPPGGGDSRIKKTGCSLCVLGVKKAVKGISYSIHRASFWSAFRIVSWKKRIDWRKYVVLELLLLKG